MMNVFDGYESVVQALGTLPSTDLAFAQAVKGEHLGLTYRKLRTGDSVRYAWVSLSGGCNEENSERGLQIVHAVEQLEKSVAHWHLIEAQANGSTSADTVFREHRAYVRSVSNRGGMKRVVEMLKLLVPEDSWDSSHDLLVHRLVHRDLWPVNPAPPVVP